MKYRMLTLAPLPLPVLQSLFADDRLELFAPAERTQEAADAAMSEADFILGDWTPQLRVNDPGPRAVFVQQPSVGVDGIDLEACTRRGVTVANTAGANANSVAEWCVGAAFALTRKTVEADAAVRRGEWPQTTLGGREIAGQKVGVIGMGAIGSRVARLFEALGCGVQYWSRSRHLDAPCEYAELDDLLATSDIVILVIALGPQTRGLIDASRLSAMKHGALLINGARGGVVEEAALIEALESGSIGGAAIDVFTQEPLPMDSPLLTSRALLSPHIAGSTAEASLRIVTQAKENLERALDGQPVLDVVNGLPGLIKLVR